MSKKEKYIEFIVNDLVDKTDLTGTKKLTKEDDYVFFSPPFWPMPQGCPYSAIHSFSFFNNLFSEYVISLYGVNKDEVKILWDKYSERIQNIVE